MTTADDRTQPSELDHEEVPGFTPETLNVHPELSGAKTPEASWSLGDFSVCAHRGRDAFWFVARREGRGGIALRSFPITGAYNLVPLETTDHGGRWRIETNPGTYIVSLDLSDGIIHMTTRFTPARDLLVAFWPRDLYVLDASDDPTKAKGHVEAAQRGLNGGYCYLCLSEPAFGSVLYMQNLTALNDFFITTKTKPDGVVGGQWPELGYQPPTAPLSKQPPVNPLKKGEEVTISDALIALRPDCAGNEFENARAFIDMLAAFYPKLGKPRTDIHDWLWRADKTLTDLKSPKVSFQTQGHTYLFPYTDSEYPDSMVQMSVTSTLWEYERALKLTSRFSDELGSGVRGFFDEDLRTMRRYLTNVGADKNPDAVDSWYLYHPLMNLARLGINGEAWAKGLFFDGLEFVIKAAQHFEYKWPIIYDLTDFSVINEFRGEQQLGQTDVGGIYAYVMLQAHQLSGEQRYIEEARTALKAAEGYRFELAYQTNLTAWGATAALKLWKLTADQSHLDQSLTFIASFLHNCELWHSDIEHAKSYANFFGVTCLHDGPYMAAYEAFECFLAFDEYLQEGGDDIPPAVKLLLAEYWRHSLDVLWGFYPDALPEDAVAQEIRNGHIDRSLSFPLEDLYGDGSPAGQVGQEIYGAGAAFVVASRAYRECPGAPFRFFAEYPAKIECVDDGLRVRLHGPAGYTARIRLIASGTDLADVKVAIEDGDELAPSTTDSTFHEFEMPADGKVRVTWSAR